MRAATEGSLPPVTPEGNLVEVLCREVRQGSPGELMVESTPSRQRRPPCKTNKEESDEAADAAALTYLLTYFVPKISQVYHHIVIPIIQSIQSISILHIVIIGCNIFPFYSRLQNAVHIAVHIVQHFLLHVCMCPRAPHGQSLQFHPGFKWQKIIEPQYNTVILFM